MRTLLLSMILVTMGATIGCARLTPAKSSPLPACPLTGPSEALQHGIHSTQISFSQENMFAMRVKLIKLTFNNSGPPIAYPPGQFCVVPDQIAEFNPDTYSTCDSTGLAAKTAVNFSAYAASTLSTSSSELFGLISGSESTTTATALGKQIGTDTQATFTHCSVRVFQFAFGYGLEPDESACAALEHFLTPPCRTQYEGCEDEWTQLFMATGDSYITSGDAGGAFQSSVFATNSFMQGFGSTAFQGAASGQLAWMFKLQGGVSTNAQLASSLYLNNQHNSTFLLGGTPSLSVENWLESLVANPVVTKMTRASVCPLLAQCPVANMSLDICSAARGNATAKAFVDSLLVPFAEFLLEQLTRVEIPSNSPATCGGGLEPVSCQRAAIYGAGSCCTKHSAQLPNETKIREAAHRLVLPLNVTISSLKSWSTARLFNPTLLIAATVEVGLYSALWEQGRTQVPVCTVTYVQGGCPSYTTDGQWMGNGQFAPNCGGSCAAYCPNGPDQLMCSGPPGDGHSAARGKPCCGELPDGRWLCPHVCPSNPFTLPTLNASWPAALKL